MGCKLLVYSRLEVAVHLQIAIESWCPFETLDDVHKSRSVTTKSSNNVRILASTCCMFIADHMAVGA